MTYYVARFIVNTRYDDIPNDLLELTRKSILDGLRGWEVETSLVDIPEPVLYPGAILVYTHLQIEGYKHETRARQTIVHRRVAVFRQQSDHSWRLAALSMAPS